MYIPRKQMTSIFEGQPLKTRPFLSKTSVIWVPGIYIYNIIYIYIYLYIQIYHSGKDGPTQPPKNCWDPFADLLVFKVHSHADVYIKCLLGSNLS